MPYDGPIDLDALIDLDSLTVDSTCHWTFFAFPIATIDEHGLPSDPEAQRYIAAVQATGVPIGIWLNGIANDTGYAAVKGREQHRLNAAVLGLSEFPTSYAADLCERLFREHSEGGE